MATPSKHNISFSRHLWLSVMALFLAITACFMFYQYRREKTYRADIIDARLQCYNTIISTSIDNPEQWPKDVRITILKVDGSVVADNVDNSTDVNHLDRPEVIDAIKLGTGKDIRRKSATVGDEYFYSATYFKDKELIVRTALPYNHSLIDMLAADKDFLWLSIVLIIFFAIIYEQYTQYLGQKIESKR
ncbi:MAG: two-component sensor histidine kinase, partial [Bacteroidales bacterium]|nr:two-component sensor histidine kinase [Bacteroidales bacterium]